MLLGNEPDLEICGETGNASEALRQAETAQPDLVIVDLALKGGHGLELIREIKRRQDRIRILVSSMHEESLFAERALRAGAMGYVNKQESSDKIVDAIRHALRGEVYLSSRMAGRLWKYLAGGKPPAESPVQSLTDRELEVFEMIGRGLSTKQIANSLNLSPKTIESHRDKIRSKLSLTSGSELTRHATQWVLEGSRPLPPG